MSAHTYVACDFFLRLSVSFFYFFYFFVGVMNLVIQATDDEELIYKIDSSMSKLVDSNVCATFLLFLLSVELILI